jgi:hypothetical protein
MVNSFSKVIDVVSQNQREVKSLATAIDALQNNQHQQLFGSIDYCCNRVLHTVLFNQVKEYTVDNFIGSIFPGDLSSEEVKCVLEKDGRFQLEEVESGNIRVTPSKTALVDNEKLLRNVEEWKDDMSKYFRKHNCDVKLCMLPQLVKRPAAVPKDVKLVDILNSDPQRRFLLINAAAQSSKRANEETMVKYKHTPDEVEFFHEEWRSLLVENLLKEPRPIPLVTLGTQVTKPKNLGKNQKLIDVVKADPSRFRIIPDLSHNSLTRICLTDRFCMNLWRQQILREFSKRRPSCEQEILLRVPRPLPLSRNVMPSDLFPQNFWDYPSQHRTHRGESAGQFVGRHQNQPLRRLPQTTAPAPMTLCSPSLGPPPGFHTPDVKRQNFRNNGHSTCSYYTNNSSLNNLENMSLLGNTISDTTEVCPPTMLKRQVSDETQTVLSVVDFLYD